MPAAQMLVQQPRRRIANTPPARGPHGRRANWVRYFTKWMWRRPADRAGRKLAAASPTVGLVQRLAVVLEAGDFVLNLQFLTLQFC
jgi:hypothetical protein